MLEGLSVAVKGVVLRALMTVLPAWAEPWVSGLLSAAAVGTVFGLLFGIVTVLERKGLARMQNRYGPNRVGIPLTRVRLAGFGQFLADGIKALTKEDLVPRAADRVVHFLAPVVMVIPALLALSVIPYGRECVPVDLEAGLLFFFAVGAATELAVFMAGWSSRNKYSLLGAMRGIAQMLSYEVPLVLAVVPVVMAAGSLSLVRIVEAQAAQGSGWTGWYVTTPWGLAGFLLFLAAALAEANRSPFDLPEGESEIVAGYFIEYSGFKFALFFLGEYLGLFAALGLAITLFLGGWQAPVTALDWLPSWFWFFAKLLVLIGVAIWVRGSWPRLRVDQLMGLAWKFMLPLALVNLVSAVLWRYVPGALLQWAVCGGLFVAAYVSLARGLAGAGGWGRRTYRFAE
ncbi:NADH-quinone oxidoreductase subunit NuoH [Limisphaera ngatamarikiensis]|uniref:NADH-quinone oxidoreductase subunit H n=1 Tax=Limisphaera ngatamarikiensis TaxID=1324935 RepID=A0A6M1RS00_9BACT|nr:NADH-quinone oxidoreductase subunit NuoH [Limisphaera ngatamarikiensis]NGO38091.1 NADH-quinone oxidoreductase subunit NuoH [Limisphaera ngatamarikiensis]